MHISLRKNKNCYKLKERKEDYLTHLVIKGYSYEKVLDAYTKKAINTGLWASEQILIKKYFGQNTSVLDIGCGAGRTSMPLAEASYVVTAIDITPGMIRASRTLLKKMQKNNLNIKFRLMNVSDLKFPDNSFNNALFSFNGIEHLPGVEGKRKAFQEVFRVLKPNGYFVFSSHVRFAWNRIFLQMLNKKIRDPLSFDLYSHRVHPSSIKKLLRDVGFEVIYCNSIIRIMNNKKPPIIINLRSEKDLVFYVARKPRDFV